MADLNGPLKKQRKQLQIRQHRSHAEKAHFWSTQDEYVMAIILGPHTEDWTGELQSQKHELTNQDPLTDSCLVETQPRRETSKTNGFHICWWRNANCPKDQVLTCTKNYFLFFSQIWLIMKRSLPLYWAITSIDLTVSTWSAALFEPPEFFSIFTLTEPVGFIRNTSIHQRGTRRSSKLRLPPWWNIFKARVSIRSSWVTEIKGVKGDVIIR